MKKFLQRKKNVLFIVVLTLFFTADICVAAVVKINMENKVRYGTIYLKDLAIINAPNDILQKISDIKIGSSPQPGGKKNIPASLIRSRIFSVIPKKDIEVHIPAERVTVERDYQLISGKSLQNMYRDHVGKKLKGKKFKISKINIKGNKKLPIGKLSLDIEEKSQKKISGHYRLIVHAEPAGGKKIRILISGWIDRYDNVVFAKNEILKGETIYAKDLNTELTNTTKYPSDIFNSTVLMTGQVARIRIRKDVLIRQKMLVNSPVIKKGEMVKLSAKAGSLTVVTIGRAVENAQVGDQIKVMNLQSKKIITGFVTDSKIVEVVF